MSSGIESIKFINDVPYTEGRNFFPANVTAILERGETRNNCSLTTIAAIYGKTVSELKKDLVQRYPTVLERDIPAERYFVAICPDLPDEWKSQFVGIKKYCADYKENNPDAPKIIGEFEFYFTNNIKNAKSELYNTLQSYPSNSSFAVFIGGGHRFNTYRFGSHFVYGQKDSDGAICFIDFQRDKPNDFPEVLDEPMFSILIEKDGEKMKAKRLSDFEAEDGLHVVGVIFDKKAPEWVQNKIESLKKTELPQKNDATGNTAVHLIALEGGDRYKLASILNSSPELIWQPNANGLTPIQLAFNNGNIDFFDHLDKLKIRFDAGAVSKLYAANPHGSCPPEIAGFLLLELLNQKDIQDTTIDLVIKCIRNGASALSQGNGGRTCFDVAIINNNIELLNLFKKRLEITYINKDFLLKLYIHRENTDGNGNRPVHIAAKAGHMEMLRELHEWDLGDFRVNLNARNNSGDTPVHIAAKAGHMEMLRQLHQFGANLNVRNNSGDTPVHIAAKAGHMEMLRQLHLLGANLNITDNSGDTPAHIAAKAGNIELFEQLCQLGADPNVTDNSSNTAADLMALHIHKKSIELRVAEERLRREKAEKLCKEENNALYEIKKIIRAHFPTAGYNFFGENSYPIGALQLLDVSTLDEMKEIVNTRPPNRYGMRLPQTEKLYQIIREEKSACSILERLRSENFSTDVVAAPEKEEKRCRIL